MIPCPKSVIIAGAHLVKIRHAVKSVDDAKHVGLDHEDLGAMNAAFKETRKYIEAAMLELRAEGIFDMEFGPGLLHFSHGWDAHNQGDSLRAWAEILTSHDCFRRVLHMNGIANPTNNEIASVIGYGNWR